MGNDGVGSTAVSRSTREIFDSTGKDISRGPINGEGIIAIYEIKPEIWAMGRQRFDFDRVFARKREGLGQKTSKDYLTVAVVPPTDQRVGKWDAAFLLMDLRNGTNGAAVPHVYVSEVPGHNSILWGQDDLNVHPTALYTNVTGKSFEFVDYGATNRARFYTASRVNGE